MCPHKGDCCVQISPRATNNLNWIVHVNSILSVVCGAKICQILNQLQIQLLITYRHDMTYNANATFYQSLQILFILSMIFPHLCILNVWTNIDLISCLRFYPKKASSITCLNISRWEKNTASFTVVCGREPLIVNYFGKCQVFDRSQSLLRASSAREAYPEDQVTLVMCWASSELIFM